jgi:predicted deacylase
MRILVAQKMIEGRNSPNKTNTLESRKSSWLRAKKSGIGLLNAELGEIVTRGQQVGVIYDSLGRQLSRIIAHQSGIIIGKYTQPLINQGDALYHIGEV